MLLRLLAAGLALCALATPALAFPDRPVTLITGYGPGGSTDIAARLLADRLGTTLGRDARVVVENRPGAAGIIAGEWLRRQPADGYVLMLAEAGSHAISPAALVGGTRYRPVEDFTQLGTLGTGPLVVVTNKNWAPQDAPALLATLKAARPDSITYATSGIGTPNHLTSELIGQLLGTRFIHVPYRSGGQQLQAIFQGEGQWGVAVLASAAGQIRDGLVRPMAVTGPARFPGFPEIPTLAESGLPGFDLETWNVILGPPNMPQPVAEAINRAIVAALEDGAFRDRLINVGLAPWQQPNGLPEARTFLQREVAKFQDVVTRTGVRLEP